MPPSKRAEFQAERHLWLPREDTPEHRRLDKRQPGLFKLEAVGTEMTCLSSKSYCLYDSATSTVKFSAKGVNKAGVEMPMDLFNKVLFTGDTEMVNNRGFRSKDNKMFSYDLKKVGFSTFYCKRRLSPDGISTSPLEIVLMPKQYED